MTIHGPGTPITMGEIQAEFGGGNPMSLSNYYAGGPYVPAGCSGTYGPIPSSGQISLRNFYGAMKTQTLSLAVGHKSITSTNVYGYSTQYGVGSLTPNTIACMGSSVCTELYWYDASSGFTFIVQGKHPQNSFTTITINGNAYRSDAVSFYHGAGTSEWDWNTAFNPFGTGGTISIVIT